MAGQLASFDVERVHDGCTWSNRRHGHKFHNESYFSEKANTDVELVNVSEQLFELTYNCKEIKKLKAFKSEQHVFHVEHKNFSTDSFQRDSPTLKSPNQPIQMVLIMPTEESQSPT